MAERPLYTLYKNLKAQNYDVPDDYNKFESALTRDGKGGADNRHAIYENLKAQNFDVPSTYERFYSALFEPRSKTSSRAKGGSVPMSAADRARYLAVTQSVLNTARQVKRASGNIRKTVERAKKFNANDGKVTIGFKNPLQNQNVQKNEFNYNATTGKTGTYTTTDGVEFDNEYDAAQYQNKLDKYGEEWNNAVDMGIVPSELDKADPELSDTDVAMRQMERRQEWLNENQDRRSKELNESMHLQGSPFVASGGAVAPSSFNTAISNEANRLSDVEYGAYNTAKAYNQMLRTTLLQELKEQKQRNENAGWWKDKWNDVSNYFGGMLDTMFDPKLYSQGVMDAAISNNLLQVKKGMEDGTIKKGSNAGNAAQAMLGAIQQQQGEAAKQQQYGTKSYQYGDMSGRSLKFMADFALSGWRNVMTTGFTKAGEKVGEKMALGALGKWFTKNTGRVLGDIAGSAALAATNQLGSTYNNVIERYVGINNENGGVTQDKNGDLKFNEGVSLGKAIKDGFGSATIENFSEMFGEYLPGASKLLSKLGISKVSSFFEKIGNNAYYKWLSNATNKSGIQGVMAEISEEEFGTALHAAWGDGDGSWRDFNVFTNPDAREKQIDTCLGMFYSVGFMQAPRTAVGAINAVQYFNIKHQVAKADKFGQMMFNDKWEDIKSKIDVTTNADLTKTVLDATRSDSMTAKQKGAVINYAMFLSKLRGFNQAADAKTKDKVEEGDTAPTLSNDLDDAYTEGHDADDADKHNIQLEQNDKANELAAMLNITPEQLYDMADEDFEAMTGQDDKLDQAIYDYQVSTAKYQGVMDGAQDEVDMAAHQAAMETDNMTDLSRGTVRKATIKATGGLEDYEVYIISGNIATHDDGSIDVGNSDDMIIYYDPTTGRKEHADAMMFADLIEELPAADVKAQAINDAKENAIKEIAGIIDGTVEVGSQFNVTDTDGTEHTYEVLADYGDGTAAISIDGNVVENPYSLADLQQMKDLEDQKRLEAAKAEREQMEKERDAQQNQETEQSQPSFDFNQILNDNGNVVLADVLGKDGNTKYPNSQLFLIRDSGVKAKVMELKSDGTLVPHAVNKKDVRTATTMTLDEYKQAFADSSMIEDNSGENRGEIEVENQTIDGESADPTDVVAAPESADTPAPEQTPAITLEDGTEVPMLEDGNPDFSKLTAEQTAELYDTQFGEDADSIVSGYVSDAKKALDKARNMTVKGKTFVEQKAAKDAKEKAIADAQAAYDSAIAIRDAYNERQLDKEQDTPDGRRNLIEKARRKFARLKSAVKDDAESVSQLYRETIGSLLHRLYDSTGIDVTDTIPLTAEEYVASNLGAHSLNYEGTETSKGVKQETGLSREDFAKTQLLAADGKGTTIDDLVHSLWENRPSNLESLDTQDIRNALIGVLNSGFKASEARNYIENLRIAQAENILEEQKKAADNVAFAEENKAESEQQTETAPESEEKTEEDNSDEINDEENEQINAPEQNKFPDKLKEGSKTIEVPEDATDENPLGAQRDQTDLPFSARDNGTQQTTSERAADVEKNKVDDMKVVDNIVGEKTRKAFERLAKMMGANIQWQYSDKLGNGWIQETKDADGNVHRTIFITLDSSITEGAQFIFGHEITHQIKNLNPAAYNELTQLVLDTYGSDAFDKAIDETMKRYSDAGFSGRARDYYAEEVVADAVGEMIRDLNLAHTLAMKMSHPLLAAIHEVLQKIKLAFYGTEYSDVTKNVIRSIEQAYVKTANREAIDAATHEGEGGQRLSLRTKPEPKKTQKVYKLMRLGEDGKLYPLFIGSGEAIELGKWYDADSPKLQDLTSLSSKDYVGTRTAKKDGASVKEEYHYGAYIVNNKTGEAMSLADFKAKYSKQFARMGNNPNKKAVDWATDNGYRWIKIEEKNQGQSRYGGEARSYYNYGINGSGSVSIFAMRPGWHAGSLPTMRQIGKGSAKNLRDDTFVWVEGEIPAEIDYNEEAQKNADKDIPDHIPTDGYYLKATNANKEASQADKVGWYVAGAFMANRIMSDKETRDIIDEWNAAHPDDNVEYDWKRESGKDFNSETMSLEDTPKFSLKVYHGSGADFTEFDFDHMGEGAGSQVFGWGGYVTSSEKIGKSYAGLTIKNRFPSEYDTPQKQYTLSHVLTFTLEGSDKNEAIQKVKGLYNESLDKIEHEHPENNYAISNLKERIETLDEMEKGKLPIPTMSLYEVDIPDDNGSNYLEWDGDVPSNLDKEKLAELILDKTGAKEKVARFKATPAYLKGLEFDIKNRINEAKTGQRLYINISSFVSEKDASEILSSLGYTGIKYPAGTIMGGAEEGDTNYVIFNPKDMKITEHTKFSIKTYHGSQASFDKFDHSFMGSGEGAQAYGWGTYVSEVEGIAKAYAKQNADRHSDTDAYNRAGMNYSEAKSSFEVATKKLNEYKSYVEYLKNDEENYKKRLEDAKVKGDTEKVASLTSIINSTEHKIGDYNKWIDHFDTEAKEAKVKMDEAKKIFESFEKPRNLYTVDIPDDTGENYIGWDEPLTDKQVEMWKNAANSLALKDDDGGWKERVDYYARRYGYNFRGEKAYKLLTSERTPKEVSLALKDAGFDGVKVVAQRNTGGNKEGKMNYVIFDENNAQITSHTKFSLKSKPVRFEAGKKLSDEEKKEVLSTLKDAYKVNGVPYHIEETAGGKEKRVYEPTADSYVVSDITNRPLRYYITLPDGRVAHPTEVYPNISDNEVKSSATKQGLLDDEADQIVSTAIGNMKDIADNAKAVEVLTELQNLPHETHDVGYGINNPQSYNYKTGIFTSDAAQAIDYVVRRMRRKEDVPAEVPAALKKAVADSYGMVDNLIDGMSSTKFSLKDEKIKSVAEKFGVNEDDVAMYANAVERGSTADAARARANIKRYLLQANEDKISSLKDIIKYTKPINEALKENFGDLDAMIEERRKQVEAERNAMEAARKRAQEEEEKRQKHLSELSLIPTDELDKRYMDAIANNDESTAREMLDESARRNGYGDVGSDYQGQGAWAAPSNPQYESDEARRADIENSPDVNLEDIALGYNLQPDDYFDNPRAYMNNTAYGLESAHVIKNALDAIKNGEKDVKVKVYRAVPTSVKEGKLRNGDWVTPSKKYAEMHGDNRLEGKYRIIEDEVPANQLWWDGNDANEFGFDDGREYRYKNAKNNRKLNDLITYDNNGNVIPPSKRFNSRKNDIRFSLKAEKEKIVTDAKANGTYMTAPNGEKTKLNAEQWATVRTTNFKNWFGDWENDPENASKVVDENGEPMVVWHGRSAEFNTFEKKEGVRFIMGLEDKVKAEGFFFSPDKGLAEEFASNSSRHRGGKANVVPCFLNIRKPMDLTGEDYDRIYEDVTGWEYMVGMDTQDNLWGIMDEEGMADKIKEKGYDGAIFVEEVDDSYEPTKISYCALDSNQIKSAENNNGDFSADNNDIRFSLKSMMAKPDGWKQANKKAIHIAEAIERDPKFSIRTYHGTGASFDKFDLSHALEGEGSESFGHGVYVTNSSKIGREYAQRAKNRKMEDLYKNMRYPDGVKGDIFKRRVFGEMVNDVATGGSVASAKEFAKKRVGADANDIQRTLENLKDREKGTEYEQNLKNRLAEYKEGLKWIDSLDEDYLTQGNANRYDVDIPDDNGSNYLDWEGTIPASLDKQKVAEDAYKVVSDNQGFNDFKATPLNDFIAHTLKTYVNTTDVAGRVEKLKSDINDVIENYVADDDVLALNEYLKDATPDDVLATIWYNDLVRDIKDADLGEELYRKLSTYVGDNAASQILSDNGLVGIKYPAGLIHGGAKEGDYNYVIFDENNANIVGNTRFSLRYDQFEHDLNRWKKDNNLPKDAQRPTIPQRNAGESAVDFLRRVDEYRKQMALWKTAPTYEQHLLSDDTALGEFNRELQRGSVLKRIAFQDSMLAIRKAQEAIMKEVGVDRLNMAEDAYTAENRSHGKGKNEFEEYNNEFLQPLRKAYHQMKKVLGDSYDNVRIYMMAKHGLERDAQMAFKMSLDADYEDVAQRSAAYKAYKGDMNRIINDSDLEFGRVDFTTWRQKDNALRGKYSPSYMDYRYDDNGIAYDYSGLSSLFDGSDFEEAAHKLVRDVETKHLAEVQALWNATNAATKKILRDGYKAGMMSKDTYQYVRDMYSHYIPLRGWDGTTADQVWDYVGGGKGAFNQTLKTAHGRTSIADDPIAYIENMAESGILLNNKNWVKQHLMLLAQNHPTSLLTLSKAWYVKSVDANGNEEWIPATPQITSQMNSNQVKAAIDAFDKKMEQMAQTGDATQKRDGLNIAYPQTHSEEREHEVRVMKDGEEYVIYVNGDPQLAQAMNNTRAHRVSEGIKNSISKRVIAVVGRKMAAAYTSLSPLFIPSNYFRDLTMTLASTAIREDAKYNYLLRKNLATSWNLGFMLRDYQNGKLRDKVNNGNATPKEQMFYDFMMNGGETGFVSSLDVEDLKKKFKNDLKDLDRWKANPVKVGHTIMDIIEFLNRMIEDSNRFAVYMTSIQYGRSIDEAVNDAKDVTLNFNRKGTGEHSWQTIRNLYLFINPAVQSLKTLGALAKHHPFKFTAVTASWIASGVLVPIVNAALMQMAAAFLGGDGDDDKDWYKDISKKYWQFSKWDRRNNFIMWVPTTHEFVKIPLAQEFRAFYGLGDMIASKMMGGELAEESWEDYGWDLVGQVVDMLPLDPTGYDGELGVSLMPNPIRPVFELAFNVDFTGKPLFKDTEYNKYDPNFTKAYVGTPDWLVRASRMMNSIGNDYPDVQQNKWDALGNPRYNLNNPAVVDHVLSSYLGGAYTMGSQVLGLITKSLNDRKEIKVADIPLFSKLVSNPDDRPVTKKQGDEFWNMKENYDRAANTLSKLKKQAKVDGDYSMLERFYGSEEYKQYKQEDVKVKKYEEDKKKERAEESGEEYRPHKLNAEDIYKAHATPKDDFEDLKLKQLFTKLNGFKTSYDLLVDTAPGQSDAYYNTNKAAIDAIDEISLDKQEISELKKGFLDDGKDAYNAEDMKQIRELRKKILAVLERANKVVVANQKAKTEK